MIFTVAIDGPAAAGKGTISRAVAERFGFAHLDTGALYRAVGVKGGDPVLAARSLTPQDLARPDLRTLEAGQAASRVAVIPEVRAALLDFQRRFARQPGGAVLDGRDIGTVICPEAEVKLFVTASPEVRARRRWLELGGAAAPKPYEAVLAEVVERDARDMNRADAPLRPADDALIIDTSGLSAAEAIDKATAQIGAALARSFGPARIVFHLTPKNLEVWPGIPRPPLADRMVKALAHYDLPISAVLRRDIFRNPQLARTDGDLHLIEGGQVRQQGWLNIALAYLQGYFHVDPIGTLANSSAGLERFDPASVDAEEARAFAEMLRHRYVVARKSRYNQPRKVTEIPKGCIAVFLQGVEPSNIAQHHMTSEDMLRAVAAAAGPRPVVVKLHPLAREPGLLTLAKLADDGLELPPVEANIHDVLAACDVTVSFNSAASVEGLIHGKPAVLCGQADFAQFGQTATTPDEVAPALQRALDGPRDFSRQLYWYFSRHTLDIDSPGFEARLFAHLARFGFPRERFGLPPL
jgi:cytidylate kinase